MLHKRNIIIMLLAVFSVVFLFMPQRQASAFQSPDVSRLITINDHKYGAFVEADASGNIYIGNINEDKIRVFDRKGTYKRSIELPEAPTAMAISSDSLLYVGLDRRSFVNTIEVYDLQGNLVRALNLVKQPRGIGFLEDGTTYVLDYYTNKVYIYNSSFSLVGSFGSYGNTAGKFTEPSKLEVVESLGTVFVLDKGYLATEGSYANTPVWRVQKFDLNGQYVGFFSKYGYGDETKIGKAAGMAVSNDGKVFISDNAQNYLAIFDVNGVYLGSIYDTNDPITMPADTAVTNSRLYSASSFAGAVYVFGVGQYTDLSVSPTSLSFETQAGVAASAQTVTISNDGPGTMNWSVGAKDDWITTSSASGSVGGNASGTIDVNVDTTGMAPGSYTGSLQIAADGMVETVNVSLVVIDPPVLSVTPPSVSLEVKKTDASPVTLGAAIEVALTNDASGSLTWSAVSDSSAWLSVSPSTGGSNTTTLVDVVVDHSSLDPGQYTGVITVSAAGAVGSPATVSVSLNVLPPAGKIFVTTNNENATFSVSGPVSFSGTGTYYIKEDLPEGDYTITYGAVAGFRTPASQTATITGDTEINFSGEYTRFPDIVASMGDIWNSSTVVKIFTASGQDTGVAFEAFPGESYGVDLAVGDVDGDGVDEIVCGLRSYRSNGQVGIFKNDGTPLSGGNFMAYDSMAGVFVAVGDVDGDGANEIITVDNGRKSTTATIRVFKYVGGAVYDTGVNVLVNASDKRLPIAIAAGDVDGDGVDEIGFLSIEEVSVVTQNLRDKNKTPYANKLVSKSSTTSTVAAVVFRALNINPAGGIGAWTASDSGILIDTKDRQKLALGDVDGDGTDEIILGVSSKSALAAGVASVEALRADGSSALVINHNAGNSGVELASESMNDDALAEIAIGSEASSDSPSMVYVYGSNGSIVASFEAFPNTFNGVDVAIGDLGY